MLWVVLGVAASSSSYARAQSGTPDARNITCGTGVVGLDHAYGDLGQYITDINTTAKCTWLRVYRMLAPFLANPLLLLRLRSFRGPLYMLKVCAFLMLTWDKGCSLCTANPGCVAWVLETDTGKRAMRIAPDVLSFRCSAQEQHSCGARAHTRLPIFFLS